LGSLPKEASSAAKSFDVVLSCACTSNPITTSYASNPKADINKVLKLVPNEKTIV
jgi:hypothetical protein